MNATLFANQTVQLENNQEWISNPFNISFSTVGDNQIFALELWMETSYGWEFIPDYILIIRLDIFEN